MQYEVENDSYLEELFFYLEHKVKMNKDSNTEGQLYESIMLLGYIERKYKNLAKHIIRTKIRSRLDKE